MNARRGQSRPSDLPRLRRLIRTRESVLVGTHTRPSSAPTLATADLRRDFIGAIAASGMSRGLSRSDIHSSRLPMLTRSSISYPALL